MSEGVPEGGQTGESGTQGGGASPVDWEAEAKKWQGLSRKHEDASKKNFEAAKAGEAAAKELAELKRGQQTELERITGDLSNATKAKGDLEGQLTASQAENAKLRAGLAAGLSLEDMAFIPNGTPEEMEKAAKTLAQRLGAGAPPDFDGGGRTPADAPKTMSDLIRQEVQKKRGIRTR